MRMTEQIGSIPNYAALLAFEMYENSDSGQENTVQVCGDFFFPKTKTNNH